MDITKRLEELRKEMACKNIAAYIIPSSDPHGSEYPAPRWGARGWISNFHGSAGTVVVTAHSAGLWTDGRYHIFAEELLANQPIDLYKMGLPTVPTINQWLVDNLPENSTIGFDGRLFSASAVRTMKEVFKQKSFSISSEFDLLENIWTDRPGAPQEENFDYKIQYAGKSRQEKITVLRNEMTKAGADCHILTVLDDIAWLYNIRLNDAMPAFGQAYTIITLDQATLFIDAASIENCRQTLEDESIIIEPYDSIIDHVKLIPETSKILLSPKFTNWQIYSACPKSVQIIEAENPTRLLKSIKNDVEIKNSRHAHLKDGVAMVRLIRWVEENAGTGITEWDVLLKSESFRREQKDNFGNSFTTIAGYKGNAAMMHYAPTPEKSLTLQKEGFLLIDSGGQYIDGLTDTTRTLMLGPVTDEMKKYYTLVLQGMIRLSMAKFPKGTRGISLDILARQALWQEGADYRCGTGHGVGHFLNVHEGPQGFSQAFVDVPLELGMMTTVEPGYYPAGQYGIRIENIVLTQFSETTEYGDYYNFEYLTLCPIDTKPILAELLSPAERTYLNNYHATVFDKLSPRLNEEEVAWLKTATKAI